MEKLSAEFRPEKFPNLNAVIDHISRAHGDQAAFSCLGGTLSYAEINEYAERFASWLVQDTRLQPGDRIAIQLPNLLQFPVALYGALKAGLVVVNTNPLYTAPEMRHQFRDSGVRAIVILDSLCSKLEAVLADTEITTVVVSRLGDLQSSGKRLLLNAAVRYVKRKVPQYRLPDAIDFMSTLSPRARLENRPGQQQGDDLALLLYTGGTTGVAKGAMLSHKNLITNMMQLRARCMLVMQDQAEIVGAPLPLYHSYAFLLHCLVLPFGGNHNVLIPDPRNIDDVIKLWLRYRFTGFVGINTLYRALLHHSKFDSLDFSVLKFAGAGGMAMSTNIMEAWEQRTGCEIIEGYGLTECSPVVATNLPGKTRAGTVGPLVPETEAKLVTDTHEEAAVGERGELWVRGPQVMLGYFEKPEASAEALTADGWFKTGDYVEIDADGYISIVDRKKDMILVSGFNVFPNEIEDWVNRHEGVMESAAIGIADERTGESIKLFVVRKNKALSADEIVAYCKQGLTAYKVPRKIEFVDELPKSMIGKILRRKLRD